MPAALVYRHLDSKNRFLGLPLGQAFTLGAIAFFGLTLLTPMWTALLVGLSYAALRLGLGKKPEGFLRDAAAWHIRRGLAHGCLIPQARACVPRFPHAEHIARDLARRGA